MSGLRLSPLGATGEMSEWLKEHAWNRFGPRVLTFTDTHQHTPHQRLPATPVCIRVSPHITMSSPGFWRHLTVLTQECRSTCQPSSYPPVLEPSLSLI